MKRAAKRKAPQTFYGVPQLPPPVIEAPISERKTTMTPVYRVPSLYPVYFPYDAQHRLLTTIQTILEEGLFDFAKIWVPQLLVNAKWDTAAAGELSQWVAEISSYRIPTEAISDSRRGGSLKSLLADLRHLRHSAVHRLPATAHTLLDMTAKSVLVARILKDGPRTSQLEQISSLVRQSIAEVEAGKDDLEDDMVKTLQAFQDDKDLFETKILDLDEMAIEAGQDLERDDTGKTEPEKLSVMQRLMKSELREKIGNRLKMGLEIACGRQKPNNLADSSSDHQRMISTRSSDNKTSLNNQPEIDDRQVGISGSIDNTTSFVNHNRTDRGASALSYSAASLKKASSPSNVSFSNHSGGMFEFRGATQIGVGLEGIERRSQNLTGLSDDIEQVTLRSRSKSPVGVPPTTALRPATRGTSAPRTPAARHVSAVSTASIPGRRVITPARRSTIIIDLTGSDNDDEVEPDFLRRKLIISESGPPSTKRQKVEDQESQKGAIEDEKIQDQHFKDQEAEEHRIQD